MDPARSRRDYAVLLSVRKRRGTALAKKLAQARLEHQRRVDEHSQLDETVRQCRQVADRYAAELVIRTQAGKAVVLQELQAGRHHGVALDAKLRLAEAKLGKAVVAVSDAVLACHRVRDELRANDAHIESLTLHLAESDRTLARTKEDYEEEEGTDLRLQKASAAT